MPGSAEHVEERGELLLQRWDFFPSCCAALCGEAVIDSTGTRFFIKICITNICSKYPRGVCAKLRENVISCVCPEWLPLHSEYSALFIHAYSTTAVLLTFKLLSPWSLHVYTQLALKIWFSFTQYKNKCGMLHSFTPLLILLCCKSTDMSLCVLVPLQCELNIFERLRTQTHPVY